MNKLLLTLLTLNSSTLNLNSTKKLEKKTSTIYTRIREESYSDVYCKSNITSSIFFPLDICYDPNNHNDSFKFYLKFYCEKTQITVYIYDDKVCSGDYIPISFNTNECQEGDLESGEGGYIDICESGSNVKGLNVILGVIIFTIFLII